MNKEIIKVFEKEITKDMRPIIPYYGGKQMLTPLLLKYIPDISTYETYIEPFAGGACLFFAKKLSKINYLNEINSELTNMYLQMQLHKEEFIYCSSLLPFSEILNKHKKYKNIDDNFTKAVLYYYSIIAGYNHRPFGGYPYGKGRNHVSSYINYTEELDKKINKLRYAQIFNRDAIQMILQTDYEKAFFYLDPPYPSTDQGSYKGYTEEDFYNLIKILINLKGKFMLSCYKKNIDKYDIPSSWKIVTKEMYISAHKESGTKRIKKIETIVMNYDKILENEIPLL